MNVDVVVDAGNSFIKWGRCAGGKVVEMVSLDSQDIEGWNLQFAAWAIKRRSRWAVSGSGLKSRDQVTVWLKEKEQQVHVLATNEQIPLTIDVLEPNKVGLDRLFNAVAANSRRPEGRAAVVIDAGTAATVDYVDESGVFQGGAILPGLGIMADLLHRYTAALPFVEPARVKKQLGSASLPGKSTVDAMVLGIGVCFFSGIENVARAYVEMQPTSPVFFIGGGDGAMVRNVLKVDDKHYWPEMTLEGIRIAAELLK